MEIGGSISVPSTPFVDVELYPEILLMHHSENQSEARQITTHNGFWLIQKGSPKSVSPALDGCSHGPLSVHVHQRCCHWKLSPSSNVPSLEKFEMPLSSKRS